MVGKLELASQTCPIRVRVSGIEQVRLRMLRSPISVRVLGMPGPTGATGEQGTQGLQGPPGNLDAGVVIDGGNF